MPTPINGFLGQTTNYTTINELITKWPTAAKNQGVKLFGIAFDGVETDYLNPIAIGNLTLATNENPKSWLSYGGSPGIGVPSSYDGWFTDPSKIRAEINHDPNTNQSQALKLKWADNQNITSATIDLSTLGIKTPPGVGDQGNEVGFLQIFNNGTAVSPSNFTITRLNAPVAQKPFIVSPDGVTFTGDRTDGDFKFKIEANPLSNITFDELRLSAKPYDSPTAAYLATPFKDDSSDYLVRSIEYQGTEDAVNLQFSAPTFSVREDGTPVAAVTVTRTGSSAGTASATVNLANGTATAPADYNNAPITVNFADGDTAAKTVVVPIVDDTLVEGTENVSLSLTNPTGSSRVTLGTQTTATLNIVDNDIPGSLQFTAPTYSVREDGTPVAAVRVSRTGGSTGAVSATVNLTDGTATSPADYTNTPVVVNFAAGDTTTKTVVIPIVNDTLVEGNENISLSLGTPTGGATIGTQNAATLNVIDNDSTLQFSTPTYSVREDGTPVAAVRVTRTGSSDGAVSATVSLTDGTATAPGDYTSTPILVNFAAGDTATKTVVVPIVNDTLAESNETVNLTLGTPTGNATIGTQSTATLNIIDNDSTLQFTAPTFSVREDGTPVATVSVSRTGSSAGAVSATVSLTDGTATAPGDYTSTPIVVNFANGDTASKTVTIPIVNDTLVENTENLNLTLGSPTGNASIGTQSTATLDILDNDSSLQFSAPTYSVREDGTPVAAVRVTRTGSSAGAVSATVNLTDGTATAPADYTSTPIVVNFASGDSAPKTVVVPIANDTLLEGTENLNLTLASPTGNATIGTQSTATLNVIDNDSLLQFSNPTFSVNEDGTPIAAVRVTRTGASTGAVSATVSLADGSATSPADYTNTPIVVNFPTGDVSPKTVIIPIANDTLLESTETVSLTLGSPTGNAAIGAQSTATLNIVDNESSLQFSNPTFSVNEDGTPIAAVRVTRTGNSAGAASATVTATDGTATSPADYTNTPVVVNFAAGDLTPKTVIIPLANDILVEGTENINLTLGTPTGNATIGTQSTALLNVIDNDSSLQFSNPTFTVNEDGTPVAAVRVTRTGNSAGAVSATVTATDGTATSPADYTNTPVVVNFAAGDLTPKTVLIPVANDTLAEGTENINLTLGSPTGNAAIGTQSTALLNVVDNDSTLQFSAPTFTVNENGTPVTAVRVTRTGASTGAVSATVTLTDGTATSADYTNSPIVVNFAAGDVAPKTVIIPITEDVLVEGPETVSLTLGTPTGNASIGTQSTATLNITDNDIAPPPPPPPIAPLSAPSGSSEGGEGMRMQSSVALDYDDPLTGGAAKSASSNNSDGDFPTDSEFIEDMVSDFITNSFKILGISAPAGTPKIKTASDDPMGKSASGLLGENSAASSAADSWWSSPAKPLGDDKDPLRLAQTVVGSIGSKSLI
ncbi:MAG: Calx-beta domain-containing protein [Microcoleus sp.]